MTKSRSMMIWLIVLTLPIGACSTPMRPSPAMSSSSSLPDDRGGSDQSRKGARTSAYEPQASAAIAPQYSLPVAALLEEASRQEAAKDLTAAVGSVERALRIEPRNAHVWHRLASLRMKQGQYGMAVELAAKSNSLAGGDAELVRDNWRLMARGYRAAGDSDSAEAAERKAQAYR